MELVSYRGQAMVAHTFNPRSGRQRQADLCEFKATLGYTRLIQSQEKQSQEVVAHTFDPSN